MKPPPVHAANTWSPGNPCHALRQRRTASGLHSRGTPAVAKTELCSCCTAKRTSSNEPLHNQYAVGAGEMLHSRCPFPQSAVTAAVRQHTMGCLTTRQHVKRSMQVPQGVPAEWDGTQCSRGITFVRPEAAQASTHHYIRRCHQHCEQHLHAAARSRDSHAPSTS
jgi:hypothetical protein